MHKSVRGDAGSQKRSPRRVGKQLLEALGPLLRDLGSLLGDLESVLGNLDSILGALGSLLGAKWSGLHARGGGQNLVSPPVRLSYFRTPPTVPPEARKADSRQQVQQVTVDSRQRTAGTAGDCRQQTEDSRYSR